MNKLYFFVLKTKFIPRKKLKKSSGSTSVSPRSIIFTKFISARILAGETESPSCPYATVTPNTRISVW